VYAYALDPRLVAVLIDDLPETAKLVHAQLAEFAEHTALSCFDLPIAQTHCRM